MMARNNSGYAFHNAIRKYGEEHFLWRIIDKAYSEEELNSKEVFWIEHHKSFRDYGLGYNLTRGGDGGALSEETKRKISIANGGKNSAWYGKNHTEETKLKISKGQIGKRYSDEAKKKISDSRKNYIGENHPMFGKKHSESTREKMRESHADFKGGNHPKAKPVIQLSLDGEFIAEFPSSIEGAESLGKSSGKNINSCCRGKSKTAYGFIWKFKEDYNSGK